MTTISELPKRVSRPICDECRGSDDPKRARARWVIRSEERHIEAFVCDDHAQAMIASWWGE